MAEPKADEPIPVVYRSRPTRPNPFGDLDAPTEGDLDAVIEAGRIGRATGVDPVIEYRVPGAGWTPYHPVVTLADLSRIGLAREVIDKKLSPTSGKMITRASWDVSAEGHRIIGLAATADPLTFDLNDYRPKGQP